MKIGDEIKVKRKKKTGEVYYTEENSEKKATIVDICKNFIVIQYKEGYRECFRESELINGVIKKT